MEDYKQTMWSEFLSSFSTGGTVLVVTMGSFCDYRLLDTAMKKLLENHRVVFMALRGAKVPSGAIHVPYDLPGMAYDKDGKLKHAWEIGLLEAAKGNTFDKMKLFFKNPKDLYGLWSWTRSTSNLLKSTVDKYNPVALLAHYVNMATVLISGVHTTLPCTILHFAPGLLPNRDMPNIGDKDILDMELFASDPADRRSTLNVDNNFKIFKMVKNWHTVNLMTHIFCFGAPLVPPIRYAIRNLKYAYIGFIRPMLPYTTDIDPALQRWIDSRGKNKKIVFATLGSAATNIGEEFKKFENVCQALDCYLIVHSGMYGCGAFTSASDRLLCWGSFIPYPAMAKKVDLVYFAGSVCLQTVCWMNATPMLFAPLTPEQALWAKLYQKRTGVPYVVDGKAYTDPQFAALFKKAFKPPRAFMRKMQRATIESTKRSPENIYNIVMRDVGDVLRGGGHHQRLRGGGAGYSVGERLYRAEARETQRLLDFPVGVPEVEAIVNGSESAKGEGKSGSDVYSSPRLFIKSLNPVDVTGLKSYMPAYAKHLAQYGKESLLPAFFMVFTLERDGRKAGKFVVMRNMLRGVPAGFRTYDLKGSWSGRYNKGKGTKKDNNFRGQRLVVGQTETWARVRHFLGRDVRLLARLGLMDYSLLLVVADQPWQGSMAGALAGRPVHFQVHIVDVLMPFVARKRLESLFKAEGASSKPPADYACRFLSFLDLHIVPASVAALELADPCDDYPPKIRKEVPRCA